MLAGLPQGVRRPKQPTPSSPEHPPPHQRLTSARSAPQSGRLRPIQETRATWWLLLLFLEGLKHPQKGTGCTSLYHRASLHGQTPLQCSR